MALCRYRYMYYQIIDGMVRSQMILVPRLYESGNNRSGLYIESACVSVVSGVSTVQLRCLEITSASSAWCYDYCASFVVHFREKGPQDV